MIPRHFCWGLFFGEILFIKTVQNNVRERNEMRSPHKWNTFELKKDAEARKDIRLAQY